MKHWWVVRFLHEDGHRWAIFVKCRKRRVAMRMAVGAALRSGGYHRTSVRKKK